MGCIMEVEFKGPVVFSTLHRAFVGEGIPPIPADAVRRKVGTNTIAYVAGDEAWECFVGAGTSETSQTYYWPTLALCPRAWTRSFID